MTDLSPPALALTAFAVTLAYTVFGFSGFGANLVALPLLVHVMPVRFAVPMLLVLDLFSASLMGLRNRRLIDLDEIRRLVPKLLVGMLAGLVVLRLAAESWLLLLLGVFVLAVSLWNLLGRASTQPVSTRWSYPAGLVGGVFSTLFGTGGPVYTVYLARRISDTSRLRATIGALILGSAAVRLLLFSASGFLSQATVLTTALLLVPFALVGYLAGSRIHARLPQAQVRRVIWLLLVVSGATLLVRGLPAI